MSVRPRVAFAAAVAGLAGAVAVLTGTTDANVGLLLLLALAPFAGAAAVSSEADAVTLSRHVRLAPALAIVAGAGAIRAGSASFADVRGANAVAGIALARGPAVSVAGAWLALAGGVVALVGLASREQGTKPSPVVRAVEAGGVLALGLLLAGLFAGPQVRAATDAIWWAGAAAVAAVVAWRAGSMKLPEVWVAATVLAAAGLALILAGGAP